MRLRYFLLISLWIGSAGAHAADPFVKNYYIYDFSPRGTFRVVRRVHLREVEWLVSSPNGTVARERRIETIGVEVSGKFDYAFSSEGDVSLPEPFVAELQKSALDQMLRDKYIPRQLYDDVIRGAGIWDPSQIRYIVEWSEVTVEEWQRIYREEIPKNRLVDETETGPLSRPDTKLKVMRAGVMLVLGQKIDASGKSIVPVPLAWQKFSKNRDQPMAKIDRRAFPYMAEFSRAYSSEGPLNGSFLDPLRIGLTLLNAEADLSSQSPREYLVFAESFAHLQTQRFRRRFLMREWSQELKTKIEADPENAFVEFESSPRFKQTQPIAILATTLENAIRQLSIERLSLRAHELSVFSEGAIAEDKAEDFYFRNQHRIFLYLESKTPEQKNPIVFTKATDFLGAELASEFSDYGINSDRIANELLRRFVLDANLVDYTMWSESLLPLPSPAQWTSFRGYNKKGRPLNHSNFWGLQNLSERAAIAHPRLYVARAVLAAGSLAFSLVRDASAITRGNFLNAIQRQDPQVSQLGPQEIFTHYPLIVSTYSSVIASELSALDGVSLGISPPGAHHFLYDAAGLARLTDRFPHLDIEPTCAEHLTQALRFQLTPRF